MIFFMYSHIAKIKLKLYSLWYMTKKSTLADTTQTLLLSQHDAENKLYNCLHSDKEEM